ncbi:unnamed protein product [Ectocarpus sp. CCAP 1310/34]|nr:unnamed protein product [Ectocarpus sp. CCAP 1310/34]
MAPIVADATAAVVMAAAVLVSSSSTAVAATARQPAPDRGAAQHHRRRPASSYPTAAAAAASTAAAAASRPLVLAWAGWDRRRSSNSRDEATLKTTALRTADERTAVADAADSQRVLDSSWTQAAFRAFHEMRAGPPPPSETNGGEEEGQDEGGGGATDLLAGVRRLVSRPPTRPATMTTTAADTRKERTAKTSRNSAAGSSSPPARREKEDGDDAGPSTEPRKRPQSEPACWHMRGRLTNTATGQTIALVEGVELARSLAFETASSRKSSRGPKRPAGGGGNGAGGAVAGAEGEGELEVDKALKPGRWTAFGALATSKFFMYQDPATGEPMDHFRNTPVEKKQAVRTYERFSQVVSHLLQPNGRVLVVSEWGGRSVKAETANNNGVEEIEGGRGGWFPGGARDLGIVNDERSLARSSSSPPRRVFNLHFFVEARTPKEERELKRWQERPGARWIAFGSPPPRAHGCKEVYSYVTGREREGGRGGNERKEEGKKDRLPWAWNRNKAASDAREGDDDAEGVDDGTVALASSSSSSPRLGGGGGAGGLMSYTRYGECPTWYGTGRMCGLDVQARRVDSFASLPAKLREEVLKVDPEFEAGPPGTMGEVRRAAREQRLEREEERRRKGKRSLRRPFGTWGSSSSPDGEL